MVKPFKNLLLQNPNAGDLGTWYVGLEMWAYQVCLNNNLKMTLTYLTSKSNLLPYAFKWQFFRKVDFFQYCGSQSHYSCLICSI